MNASLLLLSFLLTANPVETQFSQVAPVHRESGAFQRTQEKHRAVVLLHGFKPHPFSDQHVCKAEYHGWQKTGSDLVTALGGDADVYSFSYAQNATVEETAKAPGMAELVRQLKGLDYREIVLVGHSTGGLIAREFVEDNSNAGVTKVIQLCAPNGGTSLAKASFGIRKIQEPLLESLTRETRQKVLRDRADRKIPDDVEFVCVVCQFTVDVGPKDKVTIGGLVEIELNGTASANGDGVVATDSQWSPDLQRQGIPAVVLPLWHNAVMRNSSGIAKIAELVNQKQPRWTMEKVAEQKPRILNGKK